jgi:acyl dehydratase
MAEMSKNISLPEGAILVSQTLEFYRPVHLNDSITAIATVTEKLKSRRLDLLAIGLRLFNQNNEEIAFAETRFILNYSQRI